MNALAVAINDKSTVKDSFTVELKTDLFQIILRSYLMWYRENMLKPLCNYTNIELMNG